MSQEQRRIHVTGTGRVTKSPDFVVLSLTLSACNAEYADAVKVAAQQIEMLRESLVEAGFNADDLKTANFNVEAKYEREEFRDGSSKRFREIFVGFDCRHDLTLGLDFDAKKIDAALFAVTNCLSQPKISVAFTVKDPAALYDKILKSAARDAKRKAKILCEASGVTLGKLIEIIYAPEEISVCREISVATCDNAAFNFRPEDLIVSDTAEFFWEIE
ncbi:MAG: SIMPL domain-containing protein [Selenomonadaceae bacterium]|nr:SIMPL domain-containing protein [Selenomonadaceae bacterium]